MTGRNKQAFIALEKSQMTDKTVQTIGDKLNIIWTIGSKDIVDALKNRVVVSMIFLLSIMLLVPKALPYIFEQTQTVLPIYSLGDASMLSEIKNSPDLLVQELHSEEDWKLALCGAIYPEIGLILPANFEQVNSGSDQLDFQGYVCWSKRHQVSAVLPKLEGLLSQSLGRKVEIKVESNIVFPATYGVLYISLAMINTVVMILIIGIFTVPTLILEEKETKTMQAMLVSPASITQVVAGKTLAGLFYILVSALLIFLISWVDVIHWDMVLVFVIGSGIFSVAVGLLLGSLFDKQQDMVGWMTAIVLFLVGATLIKALGVELPHLVSSILTWVPSVALAVIYRAALSETISAVQIWSNFGIVLTVSLLLYGIVIYKIKRSDR
jgi:ABC-2 type transport system permease protein